MHTIDFDGFYQTGDGIAALVYEVELRDDLDGTFEISFAAIEVDEAPRFALVVEDHGVVQIEYTTAARELLTTLIDERALVACINYDNTGWEAPGGYMDVLLGRDLGAEFDVVQRRDLDTQDVAALREIRQLLSDYYDQPIDE